MDTPVPKRRSWRVDVSPKMLAVVFILGVIQYWAIGALFVYRFVSDSGDLTQLVLGIVTYLFHWSSVAGLIGLAVSRGRVRAGAFGAMIGLILAAALMT